MSIINEIIGYVKDQISFYTKSIENPKTRNVKFFEFHLEKHKQILEILENLEDFRTSPPLTTSNAENDFLTLRPDDIKGLPAEVLQELGLAPSDYLEFDIVNVIDRCGGTMSLDHIILHIYKDTGELLKRKMLTAKLYRMVNKGLIYNYKDKRGVYTIDARLKADDGAQVDMELEENEDL